MGIQLNIFQRKALKRFGLGLILVALFSASAYLDAQEQGCMANGHSWGQCTGRG
jgi:hypothetical protein